MFCLSVLLRRQKSKVAWSRAMRMHAFYWVLKCPTAGRVGFLVACFVAFGVGIIGASDRLFLSFFVGGDEILPTYISILYIYILRIVS